MRGHPIIFGAESVRAILEQRKVQTRRVVKPQPDDVRWTPVVLAGKHGWVDEHGYHLRGGYGGPGDRLWVKEAYMLHSRFDFEKPSQIPENARDRDYIFYIADRSRGADGEYIAPPQPKWGVKRNALFMPRWVSRITLEITDVRVERLQDIRESDVIAEGYGHLHRPIGGFVRAWNQLNTKRGYPWHENPFCWVISFKRLEP